MPITRQRLSVNTSDGRQPSDGASFRLGDEGARGEIVAEALAQINPQRLTVAIGEPFRIVELFKVGRRS